MQDFIYILLDDEVELFQDPKNAWAIIIRRNYPSRSLFP